MTPVTSWPCSSSERGRDRRVDAAAHRDEHALAAHAAAHRRLRSCADRGAGSPRARRRRRHRWTGNPRLSRIDDGGFVAVDAHGGEHVRRLGRARRARRPRGRAHAGLVEQRRATPRPRRPRNPTCALPGDLARAVAVLERVGDRGEQAVDQAVAQRARCAATSASRSRHVISSSAAAIATAPATFDGARAQPALLAPAFDQRLERRVRRARRARRCPSGPPNLCAEIATRSASAAADGDVEPRHRLHRVGVQQRPRRARRAPDRRSRRAAGWCRPRCSRASPTPRRCGRRARRRAPRGRRRRRGAPHPRHPEALALQPVARGEHALVLERGRDHAVAAPGLAAPRGPRPSPPGCRPRCRRR